MNRHRQVLRLDQRGQALTEYVMILAALTLLVITPVPGFGKPFFEAMLDAYKAYYASFYYVLNLPFP
jgi:hypothetical protein